jgi:hypothetical protein
MDVLALTDILFEADRVKAATKPAIYVTFVIGVE